MNWIKCSERMPVVGEKVLTAYRGSMRTALCEADGFIDKIFVDEYRKHGIPATHWQPLPEPPEDD